MRFASIGLGMHLILGKENDKGAGLNGEQDLGEHKRWNATVILWSLLKNRLLTFRECNRTLLKIKR